jgi:predicted membrane-bound dolichyl-phosphate-mannose-protein mannosyltransferase
MDGVPRDLVPVTGVGDPALYAAGDRSVWRIDLGTGSTPAPPSVTKTVQMPGEVTRITYDGASQMVHVLGRAPDGSAETVYVVEPNGNSVFADARLPLAPVAWAMDADKAYPATDREQLLTFAADGSSASVSVGGNAFGWRLPGVILASFVAALIYLLLRILFRRRSVAVLGGIFVLADGMMFVQSRIAMNDVYVGFFVLSAFALFAALWTGRIRARWAVFVALPAIGLLLGLGLASKWVALYAIGGMGILILGRSALGRLLLVIGFALITATLGYMAIAVSPEATTSGGNLLFLLLMIGITLLTVVVSVLHPVAWTLEEMRFAVVAPGVFGIAGALAAFALGITPAEPDGPTPIGAYILAGSAALVALSLLMLVLFRVGARYGMGPMAATPAADDPVRLLDPPAPAPDGWLRLGSGWGLPAVWLGICLLAIPVAVYIASYAPWVALGNRFTEGFPAGNGGQTLLDLTRSMYDYHNNLRATHAASSPWWAWPMNLKPVWFYQDAFAGGTSAAIYDTGNLAIWWVGMVGMAFASWQAFKRRSLGLALLAVAFFSMWLPWSRIDRATFQYHYYAALVFLIPALAYFIADIWHGPSRRIWLLARVTAAIAIMGPALLWLFRMPLCAVVRVDAAYADSPACAPSVGDLVVTQRIGAIAAILLVAGVLILWQLIALERDSRRARAGRADAAVGPDRRLVTIGITAGVAALLVLATGFLSDKEVVFSQSGLRPELIALVALIPLGLCAYAIVTARDPRRFTLGFIWAAVVVFILFYPNISALPLPSQVFNAYQGILPTWLYPFQFPVNTDPAVAVKILDWWPALLLVALLVTAAVVAYSTWSWRIAIAERAAAGGPGEAEEPDGGPPGAVTGGAA